MFVCNGQTAHRHTADTIQPKLPTLMVSSLAVLPSSPNSSTFASLPRKSWQACLQRHRAGCPEKKNGEYGRSYSQEKSKSRRCMMCLMTMFVGFGALGKCGT